MKTYFQYNNLFLTVSQIDDQLEKLRQIPQFVRVIFLHLFGRLEEITLLVTGVKSYSIYITDWKKLLRQLAAYNLKVYSFPGGRNYAVNYWRKILQYIHYQLEEITLLFNGVKSYIYASPTGRNYSVSQRRTILQYIHFRVEEITPLITSVKSYRVYITNWKKLPRQLLA